ncbi:MAG: preprotein translocase subunit SecA, partial [Clostridia bacterium]|nr:preprotein translocase subunit SecA [Clostridia bacterium]
DTAARFLSAEESADKDINGLKDYAERLFLPVGTVEANRDMLSTASKEDAAAFMKKQAHRFYEEREQLFQENNVDIRSAERNILLNCVDNRWMDHIDAMDQLRDGIGLRAYANRDPITEYQMESYDMFDEMSHLIQEDTVRILYQGRFQKPQERRPAVRITSMSHGNSAPRPQKEAPGPRRKPPITP